MSWKDHLTPDELRELAEADDRKRQIIESYNALRRKLKSRGEWRSKQGKEGSEDKE